jgi:peroxiredoxin
VISALLGIGAVAAFLVIGGRTTPGGGRAGMAPDFTLASTAGTPVSLTDYRGQDVLLYFNEGVGCDACFYQMAELEQNGGALADAGLTVLPIVANSVDQTRGELGRFGLRTPYLIDDRTQVSQAYGMLGQGMHANLPGHGFVLIDGSGQIRWTREYPSMFVSTDDLLADMSPFLS